MRSGESACGRPLVKPAPKSRWSPAAGPTAPSDGRGRQYGTGGRDLLVRAAIRDRGIREAVDRRIGRRVDRWRRKRVRRHADAADRRIRRTLISAEVAVAVRIDLAPIANALFAAGEAKHGAQRQ